MLIGTNTNMSDPRSIEQFQQFARGNYEKLKKQCLGKVVRWAHATSPLFAFQPFGNELIGLKPGREVDSLKKGKIKYGFDADERLICSIDDVYKDGEVFGKNSLWDKIVTTSPSVTAIPNDLLGMGSTVRVRSGSQGE
jgi:hypothetical protein